MSIMWMQRGPGSGPAVLAPSIFHCEALGVQRQTNVTAGPSLNCDLLSLTEGLRGPPLEKYSWDKLVIQEGQHFPGPLLSARSQSGTGHAQCGGALAPFGACALERRQLDQTSGPGGGGGVQDQAKETFWGVGRSSESLPGGKWHLGGKPKSVKWLDREV